MAPSAAILAAQNDISPPRNNPSRSALLFGNLHKPNPILTRQLGNWQWYKKNLVFDASRGYDEEEAKYFDAVGGAATVSVGYGNKRVLQVMKNQGQSLAVGNEVHWRTEVSEEFAQALVDSTGRRMTRAAIYASGTYYPTSTV
jgi:acetylornithine/succinyldiaminopimelate/putrescine aminotransferase